MFKMKEIDKLTDKLDELNIVLRTENGDNTQNRELYAEFFNEVIKLKNNKNVYHLYSPLKMFINEIEKHKGRQKDIDPYYTEVNIYKTGVKKVLFMNKFISNGYSTDKNTVHALKYLPSKSINRFNEIRKDRLNYLIGELYKRGVDTDLYNYEKHGSTNITYKVNHERTLKYNVQINNLSLTKNTNTVEEEFLDLSDSKTTEKLIMLEKLGIIKFLLEKEPFNTSTNALASAISGITGVKSTTLQPALNPMISKSVVQKNNPLNSSKTVSKVEIKLAGLGYIPSK